MRDLSSPLGIIAGGGTLPGLIAAAAQASGQAVFVVALEGFADPSVFEGFPHLVVRLGAVGTAIAALRSQNCRHVVLAGPVKRPSLLELRPDAMGTKLLARIGRAVFAGDDGLLGAVIRILGEEGFIVLGPHEVLEDAVGTEGALTATQPDTLARADIARAVAVLHALGHADVGQACVVQQGLVLAVEAIEGTDAMLERAGLLRRSGEGGVLVKLVKPEQDRRADLPTLGAVSVLRAADAGLRGIAFEAGGTILVDKAAMIAAANSAGMFLYGIDPTVLEFQQG